MKYCNTFTFNLCNNNKSYGSDEYVNISRVLNDTSTNDQGHIRRLLVLLADMGRSVTSTVKLICNTVKFN